MKLLVLSDSHGHVDRCRRAVELEKPDLILHLGDVMRDAEQLEAEFFHIPLFSVAGNCDRAPGPQQYVDELGGVRLFACHGHRYEVKTTLLHLCYRAIELNATLALFGHTHVPLLEQHRGITFLNPGALDGFRPTYATVLLENGTAQCAIHPLKKEETI